MIVPVSSLCSGCVTKNTEQKKQNLKFNQNPEFYAKESYLGCKNLSKEVSTSPYISVLGSTALMLGFLMMLGFSKRVI